IKVMGIERVVEIEHPGLDRVEAARGATLVHVYTTRCCHSSRREGFSLFAESVLAIGEPGAMDAQGFTQVGPVRASGLHRHLCRRAACRPRDLDFKFLKGGSRASPRCAVQPA